MASPLPHAALAHAASGAAPDAAPDKWAILKNLAAARRTFGLSDRTLGVLSALVSFHPARTLEASRSLIVHPSNATLSARAHGMPESTLRRHLAALTQAGLVLRHDSPNGKRYARRGASGSVDRAFGFDLRPLAIRADDIAAAAEDARRLEDRRKRLRETATLRLRDATKLIALAQSEGEAIAKETELRVADLARTLRRKLDIAALEHCIEEIDGLLAGLHAVIAPRCASDMSAEAAQNGCHIQTSDQSTLESEDGDTPGKTASHPALHLSALLDSCPSLVLFARDPIERWPDLVNAADAIHPMLGITPETWRDARRRMGPQMASATLACILESAGRIRNPGGYLRRLAQKASEDRFTPLPMIAALRTRRTRMAAVEMAAGA